MTRSGALGAAALVATLLFDSELFKPDFTNPLNRNYLPRRGPR